MGRSRHAAFQTEPGFCGLTAKETPSEISLVSSAPVTVFAVELDAIGVQVNVTPRDNKFFMKPLVRELAAALTKALSMAYGIATSMSYSSYWSIA